MKVRLEGEIVRVISKENQYDIKLDGMLANKMVRVDREKVFIKGLFGWKRLGWKQIGKWGKYGEVYRGE